MSRNLRRFFLLPLFLCAVCAAAAFGWGDDSHRAVSRGAVAALPNEMRPFFLVNSEYIAIHSPDPDYIPNRTLAQRAEHFLDIDEYGPPPFLKLSHNLVEAEKQFGEETVVKRGLLPWTIQREFDRLVEAMKKRDWAETRIAAAYLSHFAADATMPLHATVNYDGQLTNQKGAHFRIEVEMVMRYHARPMILAGQPVKISDPTEWAFDQIERSNALVPAVLIAEQKAHDAAPLDSEAYYAQLERLAGPIVEARLCDAATGVAGLWKAAWEKAGRPRMPPENIVVAIGEAGGRPPPGESGEPWRTLDSVVPPFDGFAMCLAGADKRYTRFSISFTTPRPDPDERRSLGHAVTFLSWLNETIDVTQATLAALRAFEQFPRCKSYLIYFCKDETLDPAMPDIAKLLANSKAKTYCFISDGAAMSQESQRAAKEAGIPVIREADQQHTLDKLRETLAGELGTSAAGR
jgi:hypothetical protein